MDDATPHRLLIEHQRMDSGGCWCGWGREPAHLGRSHAQHQLDELRAAGFAIVRDFTVTATAPPLAQLRPCQAMHRHPQGEMLRCQREAGHGGHHQRQGWQWPDHQATYPGMTGAPR